MKAENVEKGSENVEVPMEDEEEPKSHVYIDSNHDATYRDKVKPSLEEYTLLQKSICLISDHYFSIVI